MSPVRLRGRERLKKAKRYVKLTKPCAGHSCVHWGNRAGGKLILAVHGYFSHKKDQCIEILASEAVKAGYSILSFDLPAHGERRDVESECHVAQAVDDIKIMLAYAQKQFSATALFACSIGASFSMIAAQKIKISQALFLSPVIDLDSLIRKMMVKADVDETRLNREKAIIASDGTVFRADYLAYLQ